MRYINILISSVPFHRMSASPAASRELQTGTNTAFLFTGDSSVNSCKHICMCHLSSCPTCLIIFLFPRLPHLQKVFFVLNLRSKCRFSSSILSGAERIKYITRFRLWPIKCCSRSLSSKRGIKMCLCVSLPVRPQRHVKGSGKRPSVKKGSLSVPLPSFPRSPSSHLRSVTLLSDLGAGLSG